MADIFSTLEAGQVVGEETYEMTRDTLVRYAGASGDFNPIHYRDDVAQSVGLPGVLAHGMLTMGVSIQPVVNWLGSSGYVKSYGVRFTKPVVVDPQSGAKLHVIATVAEVSRNPEGNVDTARIDLTVTSHTEEKVLGKAQVVVAPR